ncbi:MAG: hypothetical protein PHH61_05545 [Candidatus Nanoarchaeia archaeon]|nr:hypothetical protein [Candidatus Nanoarchaeia archaeon]
MVKKHNLWWLIVISGVFILAMGICGAISTADTANDFQNLAKMTSESTQDLPEFVAMAYFGLGTMNVDFSLFLIQIAIGVVFIALGLILRERK